MKKNVTLGIAIGIIIIAITIIAGSNTAQNQTEEFTETSNTKTVPSIPSTTPSNPSTTPSNPSTTSATSDYSSQDCSGTADCIIGTVTKIVDGDTIHVDNRSIRFSLVSAPELQGYGGVDSRNFIQTICPVGSKVIVDEDDGQVLGSYDRIVGIVTCNGMNLNEELLDANLGFLEVRFCSSSEFAAESWAIKHGCMAKKVPKHDIQVQENESDESQCDPAYPDFCIPSSPPDLDCKDIPQKRFTVLPPDPHRFDGDKDGIGCES